MNSNQTFIFSSIVNDIQKIYDGAVIKEFGFFDEGTSGFVTSCNIRGIQSTCAMKSIKKLFKIDEIKAKLDVFDMGKNFKAITQLLYAGFNSRNIYCFIMESVNGGTLFQHIMDPKLTLEAIRVVAVQIAGAVQYLHNNHLNHG